MKQINLKMAINIFAMSVCWFAPLSIADTGAGEIDNVHSSEKPRVFIISPLDGETVKSPFLVKFGLEKMSVSPAGVPHPNGGHHHLIIDSPLPNLSTTIPMDKNHHHFGKGQTETILDLPPGTHTLQLLVGDHFHRPHAEPVTSQQITITVK